MSQGGIGNAVGSDDLPPPPVVTPRARRPDGTAQARLPLDRLVRPLLQPPRPGLICITAPPGGGKTTAMRCLAAAIADEAHVRCFDDRVAEAEEAARTGLAILAYEHPIVDAMAHFELCPWTIDDCLEYLVARHREQTASVLPRLTADLSLPMLRGSPAVLAYVMDQMAADPSLATARQTLRAFVERLALPPELQHYYAARCFERVVAASSGQSPAASRGRAQQPRPQPRPAQGLGSLRWFRHEAFQHVFLGQYIADQLAGQEVPDCLNNMAARALLPEIALAVADCPAAIDRLERFIEVDPRHRAVAMAVSILLRVNPAWRPTGKSVLNLTGAVLRSALWSGVDLHGACLSNADLTGANLCEANLTKVAATNTRFNDANLRGASLVESKLTCAEFIGADLSNADADLAACWKADFTNAILTSAAFSRAFLHEVDFTGATLHRTRLCSASLQKAEVEEADFSHADLREARLTHVAMRTAKWDHARFTDARVIECDLEGLELHDADFTRADLTGSVFTGSHIADAHFRGAKLVEAGLAEIDWPNADLCDADLTHASFHLGSSRSGLVGSTIPCEGSKTGFYTDEYNEQDYKDPEEIRKACLVGADLRGARLEDTDFYLVDLREAKYTDDQHEHFARCGAILESRVG